MNNEQIDRGIETISRHIRKRGDCELTEFGLMSIFMEMKKPENVAFNCVAKGKQVGGITWKDKDPIKEFYDKWGGSLSCIGIGYSEMIIEMKNAVIKYMEE